MELPTHPLLTLVERNKNCLKSMLTHYIDATVDNQFASLKDSIETMIKSGQIGPQQIHDVTAFGTSPPPTHANTQQSSASSSHECSNKTLTSLPFKGQTRAQEHQNNLLNDVALANTINTDEQMIKQEFNDDEDREFEEDKDEDEKNYGEEIDDNNVAKCEKGICNSVSENCDNASGDDAETKGNGEKPFMSQHNVLNHLPIYEPIDRQNTQIQTNEFAVYDDDDDFEGDEIEYFTNPNCVDCAKGICDLDHERNHLKNDVFAREGDQIDTETNLDEAQSQIDVSASNNTQMNNQNDEENVINERSVSARNMEQSTSSTSGVRSSRRKRIQTKVFGDLVQSNVNHRRCGKRKSDQLNKSVKKSKPKQILDDDEDTESDDNDDQEEHTNKAIGEKFATECTTNPIQPNLVQPNRHLQCSHCLKSFDHQSAFQRHLRVHTGERAFQCDQCDKNFHRLGSLNTHKLIHQNIKRFRCNECDKQFTQKPHLIAHLRIHSGDRPFECRHCDKSFADLGTRNSHEQAIHLHVKPYRCKQCGHTATQRTTIIRHIRMVHFGLPQSIKEQQALNIIDERDPRELVEKV